MWLRCRLAARIAFPGPALAMPVVVAFTLFAVPAARALPQALHVQAAQLGRDLSGPRDSGSLKLLAHLQDPPTGTLVAELLAGHLSIRVTDARRFAATIPLTGCRQRSGSNRIRCRDQATNLRGLVTVNPDSSLDLALGIRHLSETATGVSRPSSPVRVSVLQADHEDRIDVISDCRAAGARHLACRDIGRPNIVFIVTDDQRWDTLQYTPHIQSLLMDSGVTFTNSFVTTPLCSPSRASMLTGQYAHTHGVLQNAIERHGGAIQFAENDRSTLATWLRGAGYRTGMYGKYMTDYNRQCPPFTTACYIPPGWDEWHVFVQQGYFNYQLVENGVINSFGEEEAAYSTDVLASKAADFILSAEGQPFFLHIGIHAPHSEGPALQIPAPRHAGAFPNLEPWRPPAYDEEDMSDKLAWMQNLPRANDYLGIVRWGVFTDIIRHRQLMTLLAVDEGIELLVAALDATGQLDNTVIIFTSDNGYLWGEHRVWAAKQYAYEESIRVPLVIRSKDTIDLPRTDARLALNIDLAPTIAQLAKTLPDASVDGRSLVPLLRGIDAEWRSDFLFEFFNGVPGGFPSYAAVRSEDAKYCAHDTGEEELYDLVGDPNELESRHNDPAYADLLSTMRARLDELPAP